MTQPDRLQLGPPPEAQRDRGSIATDLSAARPDLTANQLLELLAGAPAKRAYGIAYSMLRNRAEAEEMVQEGLVRAWENARELRDPGAAPAWYLRIVVRAHFINPTAKSLE